MHPHQLIVLFARACLVAFALLFAVERLTAAPQDAKPRDATHFNLDKTGLALAGYDPVAYFPEGGGKALEGQKKITHVHQGVTYRFANETNKALFVKEPAKYEPQYGGWCAYAIPNSEKVEIDPESFVVREGKLYLFYKSFFVDTRSKWQKDPLDFVRRGDAAWKVLNVPPKPKKTSQGGSSSVRFETA